MGHPDEHTLELYAIGSQRIEGEGPAIQSHLIECPHCRQVVQEKRSFYNEVGKALEGRPNGDCRVPVHIARGVHPSLSRHELVSHQTRDRQVSLRKRAEAFGWAHPYVSSGGLLAGVALLGWLMFGLQPDGPTDTNPGFVRMNRVNSTIEVFNKSDQVLFSKPIYLAEEAANDEVLGIKNASVTDLNADGENEVGIAARLAEDPFSYLAYLRIYSGTNRLLSTTPLGHSVAWRGRQYNNQFGYGGIVTYSPQSTLHQLMVCTNSNFRSPSVISILASPHSIAGEYWHYGHLNSPVVVPGALGRDPGALLVFGLNDAADSIGIQYAVMIALDPQRIVSRTESRLSRGFGYPTCDGELAYLRFPECDVAAALGQRMSKNKLQSQGNGQFVILSMSDSVKIEYTFTLDLKPLSARPLPGFEQIHARLAKEGKIRSTFDLRYIDALRDGIKFYDGTRWCKEAVLIDRKPA